MSFGEAISLRTGKAEDDDENDEKRGLLFCISSETSFLPVRSSCRLLEPLEEVVGHLKIITANGEASSRKWCGINLLQN
jgi:hypothetical protein